jgi:high affinity Mn2+ porin
MRIVFLFSIFFSLRAAAQEVQVAEKEFSLAGQATSVTQGHFPFQSPYVGQNSLLPQENAQTSETLTLFSKFIFAKSSELHLDPEISAGSGLSQTLGVAGYPNGEIYRVGDSKPTVNIARLYWKQTQQIDSDSWVTVFGRFALSDFFDNNRYSHEPRTQFLNWALMDAGAWDYAADTHGYTWGFFVEFNTNHWSFRFASTLEPEQANQNSFDFNIAKAHGDNLEFETRFEMNEQPGVVRVLAFDNHAFMGTYNQSLTTKDITTSRQYTEKYGLALNIEQQLAPRLGMFSRISGNNGKTESFAFAEIDQSFTVGLAVEPRDIGKNPDVLGLAFIQNDISNDHKNYLAAGGYGFILGDGQLPNYASERIAEVYYSFALLQPLFVSFDYQYILNPAYNSDRGPASVYGLRLHGEL